MNPLKSYPNNSARRSLGNLFSPRYVKDSAKDNNTLGTESTMHASQSKNTFTEKTLSTEMGLSEISSPRIRKEIKLPPIKMKSFLNDRSASIDTQFSSSSLKTKQILSPIAQSKERHALSRIMSVALTPLREDSIIEILSPTKLDSVRTPTSKKTLILSSDNILFRASRRSSLLDNINLLKILLSDYDKRLKRKIGLIPASFRTKTSNRYISLTQAKSILWHTQATLASFYSKVSTIAEQINNQELYDEDVITDCQTAVLGQENIMKKVHDTIEKIIVLSENVLANRHSLPEVEKLMKEMIELAKESRNSELHMYCTKLAAKTYLKLTEIQKAIFYFRLYKHTADLNKSHFHSAKAYKHLGLCYQIRQNYQRSLNYFIKMFQQAIICRDESLELLAYDYIAMQCFYVGDLQKANYFHSKMIRGIVEEEDSNLRKLIISKKKQASNQNRVRFNAKNDEVIAPSSDEETDLPVGKDYEAFARNNSGKSYVGITRFYKKQAMNSQMELIFLEKEMSNLRQIVAIQQSSSNQEGKGLRKEVEGIRGDTLLSHLSPNRKLDSYIATKGQGMSETQTLEASGSMVSKWAIKKLAGKIAKFQLNLNNAKSALADVFNEHLEH